MTLRKAHNYESFAVCYFAVLSNRTMLCDCDKSSSANCSFCLRPKSISDFPPRCCELGSPSARDSGAASRHLAVTPTVILDYRDLLLLLLLTQRPYCYGISCSPTCRVSWDSQIYMILTTTVFWMTYRPIVIDLSATPCLSRPQRTLLWHFALQR